MKKQSILFLTAAFCFVWGCARYHQQPQVRFLLVPTDSLKPNPQEVDKQTEELHRLFSSSTPSYDMHKLKWIDISYQEAQQEISKKLNATEALAKKHNARFVIAWEQHTPFEIQLTFWNNSGNHASYRKDGYYQGMQIKPLRFIINHGKIIKSDEFLYVWEAFLEDILSR